MKDVKFKISRTQTKLYVSGIFWFNNYKLSRFVFIYSILLRFFCVLYYTGRLGRLGRYFVNDEFYRRLQKKLQEAAFKNISFDKRCVLKPEYHTASFVSMAWLNVIAFLDSTDLNSSTSLRELVGVIVAVPNCFVLSEND